MSPGQFHERQKKRIARMVEILAYELRLSRSRAAGSTTFGKQIA